jgi:hypothetical protein
MRLKSFQNSEHFAPGCKNALSIHSRVSVTRAILPPLELIWRIRAILGFFLEKEEESSIPFQTLTRRKTAIDQLRVGSNVQARQVLNCLNSSLISRPGLAAIFVLQLESGRAC